MRLATDGPHVFVCRETSQCLQAVEMEVNYVPQVLHTVMVGAQHDLNVITLKIIHNSIIREFVCRLLHQSNGMFLYL